MDKVGDVTSEKAGAPVAEQRIFITGIQALVRLPMIQRDLDRARGLNTAGLISGYRGSPLGAYDQQLWKTSKQLAALVATVRCSRTALPSSRWIPHLDVSARSIKAHATKTFHA